MRCRPARGAKFTIRLCRMPASNFPPAETCAVPPVCSLGTEVIVKVAVAVIVGEAVGASVAEGCFVGLAVAEACGVFVGGGITSM